MHSGLKAMAAVAVLLAGAASAHAYLINGTVAVGEYPTVLTDLVSEAGLDNPGLDIATLQFGQDSTNYYMALTVLGAALDTNGGSTSLRGQTDFWTVFYADSTGTTPAYFLDFVFNVAGLYSAYLASYDSGTATWTPIPLTYGTDYTVAIGSAFEVQIDQSKLGSLIEPYVRAQLDDTGTATDDQIEGIVPEPATLALLTLGGVGLLMSRRRR